jgi:hypothetical protein
MCLGTGIAFTTSSHAVIADFFYALSAILFVAKFLTWEDIRQQTPDKRRLPNATAVLSTGLVLVLMIWGNHRLNSERTLASPNEHPAKNHEEAKNEIPANNPVGSRPPSDTGLAKTNQSAKKPSRRKELQSTQSAGKSMENKPFANPTLETKPPENKSIPVSSDASPAPIHSVAAPAQPADKMTHQSASFAIETNDGAIVIGVYPCVRTSPSSTRLVCKGYERNDGSERVEAIISSANSRLIDDQGNDYEAEHAQFGSKLCDSYCTQVLYTNAPLNFTLHFVDIPLGVQHVSFVLGTAQVAGPEKLFRLRVDTAK